MTVDTLISRFASRYNHWGIKHLSEESRRAFVGVLVHVHYGIENIGASVRYRTLYNHANEIARAVELGAVGIRAPEYVVVFPPTAEHVNEALYTFAKNALEDGDDFVMMDLPNIEACMAKVPLRSNSKLLVAEDKRLGGNSAPAYQQAQAALPAPSPRRDEGALTAADARDMMIMLLDERDAREARDPQPRGSWKPANNFAPLCDAPSVGATAFDNGRVSQPLNRFAPKTRTFGDMPPPAPAPSPAGRALAPADNDDAAEADAGQPHKSASPPAKSPVEPRPPLAPGATAADTPATAPTVAEYERRILEGIAAKKILAAAKAKATHKPIAKRPAGTATAATTVAAKKAKVEAVKLDFKVDISAIMKKSIVKECTKDAYMRRGYDLGLATAKLKGFTKGTPEATAAAKLGYKLAQDYLAK